MGRVKLTLKIGRFQLVIHGAIVGMATMVFVVPKWIFGRPTAWQQLSLLIRIPSLANSSVMAMLVVEVSREIGQWLQQTGVAVTLTLIECVHRYLPKRSNFCLRGVRSD